MKLNKKICLKCKKENSMKAWRTRDTKKMNHFWREMNLVFCEPATGHVLVNKLNIDCVYILEQTVLGQNEIK